MTEPTLLALAVENAALRAQLQWAEASILHLVEAVDHLDRSVHQFEATHPRLISDRVQALLHQIRQSHSGPLPAPLPAPIPEPPPRRRVQHRKHKSRAAAQKPGTTT
jgi:hypothetical protein